MDHDSTIHSPGSALAVRGTKVSLYDQAPFKPEAISLTGVAQFRNAKKQLLAFGAKGKTQKRNVTADAASAAQTASNNSVLNDFAVQQSDQQARELSYLFHHQGGAFGNVAASFTPVPDADLPQLFGGRLNFVLRWSSTSLNQYADLNIVVTDPGRNTFGNPPFWLSAYPDDPNAKAFLQNNFPQTSPLGGSVGANHIGYEGIEIATFGQKVPAGTYVIGAYNSFRIPNQNTEGLPKIPFTIEAFLDDQRLPLILNLPEVLAGKEQPVFGKVLHDAIAVSELSTTALHIDAPSKQAARTRSTPAPQKPSPAMSSRSPRADDHSRRQPPTRPR
jgi:hypothetical protein